jgi:hypothetical protein
MNSSIFALGVALAGFTLVTSAIAAEPTRVDSLRQAQDTVAQAAGRTKGAQQHLLLQEQRRLGNMIDDLEAGKPVSPREIDREINRAEHGPM